MQRKKLTKPISGLLLAFAAAAFAGSCALAGGGNPVQGSWELKEVKTNGTTQQTYPITDTSDVDGDNTDETVEFHFYYEFSNDVINIYWEYLVTDDPGSDTVDTSQAPWGLYKIADYSGDSYSAQDGSVDYVTISGVELEAEYSTGNGELTITYSYGGDSVTIIYEATSKDFSGAAELDSSNSPY